jgi:hypothetical protein
VDRITSVYDDATAWRAEFVIGHALGGRCQIPRFHNFLPSVAQRGVEEVSARTGASGDMTIHRRLITSSMSA